MSARNKIEPASRTSSCFETEAIGFCSMRDVDGVLDIGVVFCAESGGGFDGRCSVGADTALEAVSGIGLGSVVVSVWAVSASGLAGFALAAGYSEVGTNAFGSGN